MFKNFDPLLLEDLSFKEDAVREIIILPILDRLGYSPSGANRVIRSKSLKHPFIYAGTNKYPIKLIPDYTLLDEQKAILVLDAKSPKESVLSQKNIQQVYSYAIHPDIKSQHFALCNGKELSVFSVDSNNPLLFIEFSNFQKDWDKIEKHLSPKYLKNPILKDFAPDLGCALARLGLVEGGLISFLPARLNLFSRLNDNMVTANSNVRINNEFHCSSFDFDRKLLPKVLAGLPDSLAQDYTKALNRAPFQVAAELAIGIDVDAKLGPEIEGADETYRPLIVENIQGAYFFPEPLPEEPTDIPSHVFRLRKAYTLKP